MNFVPKAFAAQSNFHCSHNSERGDKARPGAVAHPRLAGSRVLVVEDEFVIALEIQTTLEEAGVSVVGPAFTLQQALELAKRETLSAATLDLRLGHDSVEPVAKILAERHIPFLFYTGQPANDPVRRAWAHSATLSKPASGDEIVHAVADIIRTTH